MPQGPDALPDDLDPIWQSVTEDLRASMPASTFNLWLEPLRLLGARGRTLYLSAPASVKTWIERRYMDRVMGALRERAPAFDAIAVVSQEPGAAPGELPGGSSEEPASLPVDSSHTFERFVIGPGNRLAHAASLAVAELPGEAYNPLFLHGPPGLGKSHLLGAIANYMRRRHPDLTVHFTTAERFTSDFVGALRADGPEHFKRRYRGLGALLIDDVQTLEGKQRTEEEFVHTFNTLYGAGKQIVLSSDRPPDALARLAERLRDRFSWGLTVELDPPDLRTRKALLMRMAGTAPGDLPDPAAVDELAARVPGNVRRLEGAMTRVLAFASLLGEPLTGGLVGRALERSIGAQAGEGELDPEYSLEAIQGAVGAVFNLTREQLISPVRTERVVRARQLAMYLARELTPLSLAQIARSFNRDHTTVLHGIRAVEGRREPGSDTDTAIHDIRRSLSKGTRPGGPLPP